MIKLFINRAALLLQLYVIVVVCRRHKEDFYSEQETEENDSSPSHFESTETQYDDEVLPLPIGNLNKPSKSNNLNIQWNPLLDSIPTPPAKVLPNSYRIRPKGHHSQRRPTRRTTTYPPRPSGKFRPQWSPDLAYLEPLRKTTTTTEGPFQWALTNKDYSGSSGGSSLHTGRNKIRPRPTDSAQLDKLFGTPPIFDWATTPTTRGTPRPRPGVFTTTSTDRTTFATERETIRIKWKPKYTTEAFFESTTTTSGRVPQNNGQNYNPLYQPSSLTAITTSNSNKNHTIFSIFNVTNIIGAQTINSIIGANFNHNHTKAGGGNNYTSANNPVTWVTSSAEEKHYEEYPEEIEEAANATSSSEEATSAPVRNTEGGTADPPKKRPNLPTRIRNTIDELKQQLGVFIEELWDRNFHGGGKGAGGKGGFGGKGGGKGGFGKGGKGGGGGAGNTWVGPYRSVLFQFNRYELNLFNGTDGLQGILPIPTRNQNAQLNQRPNQQQNPPSRQTKRNSYTRKSNPINFDNY